MEEPSNPKRARAGPSGSATESAIEQEGRWKRRKEDRTLSSGAPRQGSGGTSEDGGRLMELEVTVAAITQNLKSLQECLVERAGQHDVAQGKESLGATEGMCAECWTVCVIELR